MAVLTLQEINDNLSKMKEWKYNDNQIGKEFTFKDFKGALSFVNSVGDEAEKMDHHPDILLHSWNKVRITVATHSEGGVTGKDFELANKIENI